MGNDSLSIRGATVYDSVSYAEPRRSVTKLDLIKDVAEPLGNIDPNAIGLLDEVLKPGYLKALIDHDTALGQQLKSDLHQIQPSLESSNNSYNMTVYRINGIKSGALNLSEEPELYSNYKYQQNIKKYIEEMLLKINPVPNKIIEPGDDFILSFVKKPPSQSEATENVKAQPSRFRVSPEQQKLEKSVIDVASEMTFYEPDTVSIVNLMLKPGQIEFLIMLEEALQNNSKDHQIYQLAGSSDIKSFAKETINNIARGRLSLDSLKKHYGVNDIPDKDQYKKFILKILRAYDALFQQEVNLSSDAANAKVWQDIIDNIAS